MPTRKELYDTAQELDIEGRSDMDKDELETAVAEAQREQAEQSDTSEELSLEGRTDVSQTAHDREREAD